MSNMSLIQKKILEEAEQRKIDAGQGGCSHDGGCQDLKDQVRFYNYGRAAIIPHEWKSYADLVKKELDPEYKEYIRLKKKFEYG